MFRLYRITVSELQGENLSGWLKFTQKKKSERLFCLYLMKTLFEGRP